MHSPDQAVYWLTFRTTRDAIRAEPLMRNAGLHFRVIAVPREISTQCGMAFEFTVEEGLDTKIAAVLAHCAIDGTLTKKAGDAPPPTLQSKIPEATRMAMEFPSFAGPVAKPLPIDDFLGEADTGVPIIDVRSPAEFAQGHIPTARNIPLFGDEERAEIGTLFKKAGRDKALFRGLEIVGPSLSRLVTAAMAEAGAARRLLVHCWRGGMRSSSFCWLMNLAGLDARTLEGGYKSFRRKVLAHFAVEMKILLIGGMTGSGKSEVLRALSARSLQVLDLETLARHKGSAFGALGEALQPSTEQFENELFHIINGFNLAQTILVEDEGRNIGRIILPAALFAQMERAPMILLDLAKEERIKRLISDYGGFDRDALAACCMRLEKRMGGEKCRKACDLLTSGDLAGATSLLLEYYDKAYARQIALKHPGLITPMAIDSPSSLACIDRIIAAT